MQPVLRKVRGALRADLLIEQAQRIQPNARRLISAFMVVVVLVAAVAIAATPAVTSAAQTNVMVNGSFESGFSSQAGCGTVGNGWNCFTNGGRVNTAFHDDQWQPVVADGSHSQLVSMDTMGIDGDNDRYAGIYQTVRVVPGAPYTLNLRGMIRSTRTDGDPYRYVVQVGTSSGAFPNWAAVNNWQDTGWYTYYPREAPGALSSYSTTFGATDSYITVYVRVWKKWASLNEELNVNLDAITLTGEAPFGSGGAVTLPGGGGVVTIPGTGGAVTLPGNVGSVACTTGEMVYNGNFEQGFNATVAGAVGKGWGFFTNGGAANFGFHDDQWSRVVADGKSSQLLAIDTRGRWPADGDRFIGIFQHITRLVPGQTYELSLKGIVRGEGPSDDPNRFEGQWGFNSGGNSNWMQVGNWQALALGDITSRTDPAPLAEYRTTFVAPAASITLFFRGWSKWPVSEQEMNLNLDVISLRGCGTGGPVTPPVGNCVHIVRPGDTLSKIAAANGTTVAVLQRLNGIVNPNIIFVGQQIRLPNCGGPQPPVDPQPPTGTRTWLVRPGDTLAKIAASCGTTVWAIAQLNGITNPNLIFVGQVLRIP